MNPRDTIPDGVWYHTYLGPTAYPVAEEPDDDETQTDLEPYESAAE